jgi:DNA/RNA endonuclease G (NUC1)
MKATAYVNNSNHESESWLISPKVDLTSVDAAYFTFEHAGMYFGDITKEATVWVSKDGVDWVQLEIADEDYPTSWGFLSAGNWDLSEYLGGKVQFGFKFMSTATKSGTWEIRNVAVVSGTPEDDALPIVDPTKASWLELPATDNENLQYFTHRYEMNNQIHRNYTFAWSQKDLVSVWVAYPLCLTYMKNNVERTDAWAYDPYLKKPLSSAPFSYYAGDYDRGHQLPSADRLCSLAANKQTFYGTNIVPQSNAHNVGVWDDLEIHIRDRIASLSDTTYVVTGCVVDGATEFSTDSDGKKITIPVAFFKAVLKYKKGATTEWAAAGFYTKHEGSGGDDLKSIAMSIDELEEKLGLDFFVNLEGQIGKDAAAAVEAKDPAALL